MKFTDLLPNREHPQYRNDGEVRHLDGSVLKRPFDPPKYILVACIVGAIIAACLGGYIAYEIYNQVVNSSERDAETVEENINRDVSYDIPTLTTLIGLDDDTILQQFTDAGYTTYEFSGEDEDLDLMKLPSDVSSADAAVDLASGISSMDAVTASQYLVGSWRFTADRTDGITMSIRYADLTASDAESAIQTALESQGWTLADDAEYETDTVGNTYVEGTAETDAGTCSWTVAACSLSAVYDISGLPDTAQYVGIHLTLE